MSIPESIPEDKQESYACTTTDCKGNVVKDGNLWQCDTCHTLMKDEAEKQNPDALAHAEKFPLSSDVPVTVEGAAEVAQPAAPSLPAKGTPGRQQLVSQSLMGFMHVCAAGQLDHDEILFIASQLTAHVLAQHPSIVRKRWIDMLEEHVKIQKKVNIRTNAALMEKMIDAAGGDNDAA